jgi:hypothetical protein
MRYTFLDLLEFCQMEDDTIISECDRASIAGMYVMYCAMTEQNDIGEDDIKIILHLYNKLTAKAKERIH